MQTECEREKRRAEESNKKASPVPKTSLLPPQFKELISFQASQGYWKLESRELLQRFFVQPLPQSFSDIILCTLVALCVLERVF